MGAVNPPAAIGWIGMGKMGLPICLRLRDAGFRLKVFSRNSATATVATANGFEVAHTIGDTARGADVVVSAISDDNALLDIVTGSGGLGESLSRGQIYVDTSTVSPDASAAVAKAIVHIGCAYMRAPVSGSTAAAKQGALTALVSGPSDTYSDLSSFFAAFAKKAFLVGADEEARYLKLAINAMVGATSALLAESLMLARKGGMNINTIMDVVSESAVASPLIQYKRGAITTADYTAAFSASQMLKDFDLIEQAAVARSCHLPLISSIRHVYQDVVARGLGDKDFFVLTADSAAAVSDNT